MIKLGKKLANQILKTTLHDDNVKFDKTLVKTLVEKSLFYISRGEKNFVIELIMDKFVPRQLRKFVQKLTSLEDIVKDVMFDFVDKMNDDGLKEESFVLAMGAVKKCLLGLNQIVDESIERINLPAKQLNVIKEKIDKKVIEISSDVRPMLEVNSDEIINELDGFEKL